MSVMQRSSAASSRLARRGFATGTNWLIRRAARIWRIGGTAIGFGMTGFSCLFLALVIFPVIRLLPGTAEEKEIRSQFGVHRAVRMLFATLEFLRVLEFRCEGSERLTQRGVLVVANHPTLLDAFCLMSVMPQADCVIKADHMQNPFFAGAISGAGYIPNLNGPQLVTECADRLRRGRSVIIFPEGTRSPLNGLGPFARGAAHVALRAERDPLPVAIKCEPATLYRGSAWWDVPERRFTLTLLVDDPLVVSDFVHQPIPVSRAARALTAALRNHFERRLTVD